MSKEAKIVNRNFIIYSGISLAFFAVICIFKFLFTAIVVSYILGCMLCYYGLKSETLHVYLTKMKRSLIGEEQETIDTDSSKGCTVCDSQNCERHNSTANFEPWVGLKVHKQLDQAIEDFYNAILEQFVSSWHNKITPDPFFVDELRFQLRHASSCLLKRAEKVNYSRFLMERLIPCALRHYTVCSDLPDDVSLVDSKLTTHPAVSNRNAELHYLRSLTNTIMPYLIRSMDLDNSVFRILIREIFCGWVLLPLTDVLADPYILNSLIILSTGKETMAQLPSTPNYKVEFLETFVRHADAVYGRRGALLGLELERALADPDHLYALMQFMNAQGRLGLLQFCKHIKSFQSRILNPDLTSSEQVALFNEAWDLWVTYFDPESPNCVNFDPKIVEELRLLLADGSPNVKKLQTSRALYEAAKQTDLIMDKIMLPKFMHSEEYYKLLLGARCAPDYRMFLTKRPQDKTKLKSKHRDLSNDRSLGQLTDELKLENESWLHYAAEEEAFREQDLSTCKVVLTDVRAHEMPHRNPVRIFTLAVHRAGPRDVVLCSPQRSEHDFHLLRAKLAEFHGDVMLQHLPLPSRKDNSPLETLRYKYEDFLQRLLLMTILHNSELLTIFLLDEGDFSKAVLSASLAPNSSDLTQLYQSVTHRLRKEKGQHLESFMNVLLISSERDRWDNRKDIEVGQELDDEFVVVSSSEKRPRHVRDIRSPVYGDLLGVQPRLHAATEQADTLRGFTQCFFYILIKVVKVRSVVVRVLGSVISMGSGLVEPLVTTLVNATLQRLLSQRRLAHLIRLGHALLFGKRSPSPRMNSCEHAELAKRQLLDNIPDLVKYVAGSDVQQSLLTVFDLIQKPLLNKQLVYNLLDLCIVELFPELSAINTNEQEANACR